ncbi:MAG: hypothetical protein COV35_09340 [Alphaproteobacteria bacterium CG11_big_fil_rev_8_21_14_0_20_39_49]|nr:MAG: hypothetical protein COV35_09340 [Alphaproteobacteria bacterium CG11_big_fil_rev_8_21_14_0_20_39_49]
MNKIFLSISIAVLFLTTNAFANHPAHSHDNERDEATQAKTGSVEGTACEDIVNVSVNGLVCDFCARALEKTFGKQDEVSRINVDLEKGQVAIAMKEGMTLSDEMLTKLITDSGYNVTVIDKGC